MPLKLVRRPRPATVQHNEILKQVEAELKDIADDNIKELEKDVSDWDLKPEFKSKVHVGKRVWRIRINVDRRTRAGKIYTYVDLGTGERGGGEKYIITPKKAKALSFHVPYKPITEPKIVPGIPPPNYGPVNPGPDADLVLQRVEAKGIRPRNFTAELQARMKDRSNNQGFKRRIDKAIKRGLYRIGKRRASL